jgi:hypothetical protein
MPYAEHRKPLKVALDKPQSEGFEAYLDEIEAIRPGHRALVKKFQRDFLNRSFNEGTWIDGHFLPNWYAWCIWGDPEYARLKDLEKSQTFVLQTLIKMLKAGQLMPVLNLMETWLERASAGGNGYVPLIHRQLK